MAVNPINYTPLALMSQPINHTVVVEWKTPDDDSQPGPPLYRVLRSYNLDMPREGIVNFLMALRTDRHSMIPHMAQIAKHWCPMDTPMNPQYRYHLLFGDVRQYAEAIRFCGDAPIQLQPADTPAHLVETSHINCQYMPPTDLIFSLSAASEELTALTTDVAVLKTQVRRLQAQMVATHSLLAQHDMAVPAPPPAIRNRPALTMEPPRAKARANPAPAEDE